MTHLNVDLKERREVITVERIVKINEGSAAQNPSITIIDTKNRSHTIDFLYCMNPNILKTIVKGSLLEVTIKEYVSGINPI